MNSEQVRLICFYLPQFHPIPENDDRWGKGFTEWRRVVQAKPLFKEHYQPRLSADLGFYDLRLPESQIEQAELAAKYGIAGFCYYFYWHGGKRLLSRPFDQILKNGKPDFPFCVSWANHDWLNTWNGSNELISAQTYSEEDALEFIRFLIPVFKDPRYIRVNNKPLLVVYDAAALPDAKKYTALWRNKAKAAGLDDLYLVCTESYENRTEPASKGFDAAVEFPPHGVRSAHITVEALDPDSGFPGQVFDYEQTAFYMINRPDPGFKLFRCVMPAWDNTARRMPSTARIWHGSTPESYYRWLNESIRTTKKNFSGEERLVFINAWNEWGECAYLEPDLRYGHAYLEATQRALTDTDTAGDAVSLSLKRSEFKRWFGSVKAIGGNNLSHSKKVVGNIDKAWQTDDKICVAGWACDKEAPGIPVQVVLFAGDRMIASERTYLSRPDVAQGVDPQALRSGFHLEVDSNKLEPRQLKSLEIVIVSQHKKFANLPVKFASHARV